METLCLDPKNRQETPPRGPSEHADATGQMSSYNDYIENGLRLQLLELIDAMRFPHLPLVATTHGYTLYEVELDVAYEICREDGWLLPAGITLPDGNSFYVCANVQRQAQERSAMLEAIHRLRATPLH